MNTAWLVDGSEIFLLNNDVYSKLCCAHGTPLFPDYDHLILAHLVARTTGRIINQHFSLVTQPPPET